MARPKKIAKMVNSNLQLSEQTMARLKLHLWSEAETRVPYGKLTEFVEPLITKKLDEIYGKSEEKSHEI